MLPDGIIRVQSPCILVKILAQTKLFDLILMEQFISDINTLLCPIKYIFIFDCNDFKEMSLEFLLYWMANKILLPEQYYLIVINRIDERTLVKKMEQLLNSKQYRHELSERKECLIKALIGVINRASKVIIVDDTLAIMANQCSIEQKISSLVKTIAFADQLPINIKTIISLQEQSSQDEWAEIRFYDQSIDTAADNVASNKFQLVNSVAIDKMDKMQLILCKNQSIQLINVQ